MLNDKSKIKMNNFFALIMGVGGVDIPETVKDAEAIKAVLVTKGAYDPDNTIFLKEDKCTKDAIIDAFDKVIKKSKETPDSTVFIYYSGHGQRFPKAAGKEFDYYLIPHGADKNDKENTMLNGDIFSKKVEKIKANRILVMLDCCYAGGVKSERLKIKGEKEVKYSNRALQEKLKSGKGRVFISSCDDNETSVILPNSNYSLFTEVALEVLKGLFSKNREYVSVLDLIFYVLNEVPNRIQSYSHNQNPILTEAKNLNHKYYVCKNGNWNGGSSTIELSLKNLDISKDKVTLDEFDYEDLTSQDKDAVDSFVKKMNIEESEIQTEFKTELIKKIGGIKNIKKVNKKFRTINFNNVHSLQSIDVENMLNTVYEQIDVEEKLQFIRNYKYKI
jgi:hypothetical protein